MGYFMNIITEGKLPVQTKTSLNDPAKGEKVRLLKKHYQKPVLKTHGPVKHLTQGSGSRNGDGGQNMMV